MAVDRVQVVPNMGKVQGFLSPVGIEHIFRDPDADLVVELLIQKMDHSEPRKRQWSITWTVGETSARQSVRRVLAVVKEGGFDHYTNWGPTTRLLSNGALMAIPIATLTRAQRRALEAIAAATEVQYKPNNAWSCQDWVADVLDRAVRDGLFSNRQRTQALTAALQA